MKTNDMNEKLNPTNMQELTPEEMENVAGGGIREIVAATTLAAMAMTGNTAGAFGLAQAMAEDAGSAHIEEAPRQEAFGAEYEGEMEEIIAVESEAMEAEVAETTLELGGEEAEVEPVVEEIAVVAEEAAPAAPVYEIGGQRVMKLNELARACGIEEAILGAGAIDEDDTVKFVVFTDEDGDLAIEFTRSFEAMELGLQTESGIPTAMLVNAVIEETTEEAVTEETLEETAVKETTVGEDDIEAVTGEAAIEAVTEETAEEAITEETAEEAVTEEIADEAVTGETTEETAGEEAQEEQPPLRQIVEEIMVANGGDLVELLDAVNGRLHGSVDEDILRDALFGALLDRSGDELSEDELLDAIDASFVRASEDATVMEGITEEERADLLSRLIYDTVAAKRNEGIYAALNSTMEAVVFSDVREADPETGRIALNDSEIVGTTFDALQANFENTPEELMGAIGAAALRAEDSGLLPMLSGDQQLVMLAAQESNNKASLMQTNKVMKSFYDGTLDGISLACPEFKPFVPILKMLGGNVFDLGNTSDNTNAEILAKIDALEKEVKRTADNLKDHTYNVVQLSSLGDKYNTVADKAATIRTYIGDIQFDTNKTDEQKLQEIADLYKDSEFKSLVSAMNGATRCFTSRENDIFENQNVFEAAYERACEEVMFSKEAIDITLPYLARQLNTYIAAYATMAEVYSAQVAVYGESAVLQSQTDMSLRLTGCDLNGNKVQKSILELYEDYFGRDKFIFVGKSNNTNIKVSDTMVLAQNFAKECHMDGHTMKTPDFMENNPLSDRNVQMIADYCKEKNKSIFQFLLNEMKFDLKVKYNNKTYTSDEIKSDFILRGKFIVSPGIMGGWAYNIGPININGKKISELPQTIYLATGKQYITQDIKVKAYDMGVSTTRYWYYAQGVNATGYCTGKDEKVQIMKRVRDTAVLERKDTWNDTDYYCSFLFFQGR